MSKINHCNCFYPVNELAMTGHYFAIWKRSGCMKRRRKIPIHLIWSAETPSRLSPLQKSLYGVY